MKIKVDGQSVNDREVAEFLERNLVPQRVRAANPNGEVNLSSEQALNRLDQDHNGTRDERDFQRLTGRTTNQSPGLWGSYQRSVRFLEIYREANANRQETVREIETEASYLRRRFVRARGME